MKAYEISELIDFMPLTDGGYAIVPRGQGMRLPYASNFPPLENPWHGHRTDCNCAASNRWPVTENRRKRPKLTG